MDRRTAIRNLALVLSSAAILPACTKDNPTAHFKHFDVTGDQEALIADLAETIIPKTTTPGAKDLNLDKFVWLMLDDCTKKEDQQAFFKGMDKFNDLTKKMYSKSFADCSKTEKAAILATFEKKPGAKPTGRNPSGKKDDKPEKKDELQAFYGTVKGLTVFGYTQSQYFMTKEIVYELVPGRYNAHFPVKNNMKA
ncbi:gluconate 2-dehydrogenase subunit 3 family protein [Mucilaginibacter ginsenosidivorans]|uniref:Gluconate 2-dehydrogenase subunit 3 family protein n=1 Tax=Mucilaginibacter ginsenosidivorans TaxID=398053 RepID=A0A5B8V0N5_9SPHI|nr:gluconate 2-dehydrogenase subunit 3 family protein [Mucilaginibacter ginsenosidivorans]QEC64769.1 gluconate 2-dehydrogenase subunit 3 family protein [Mucilaginibacter ginsenosidivorans]